MRKIEPNKPHSLNVLHCVGWRNALVTLILIGAMMKYGDLSFEHRSMIWGRFLQKSASVLSPEALQNLVRKEHNGREICLYQHFREMY